MKKYWTRHQPSLVTLLILVGAGVIYYLGYRPPNFAIPPELRSHSADWPTANKDLANTRATFTSSITAANVDQLGPAWSYPIPGVSEWGAAATNPLILGNTVLLEDLQSNVSSLNFSTGALNWIKNFDQNNLGPTGVAVGWGKIFATKGNYEIVALDSTGKQLWTTKLSDEENVGIDIQLSAYDHKVFACTVPGIGNSNFYRGGSVGKIFALDEQTGKVLWNFNTVDSADIWGNPQVNSGGGCWYPPAIDTATDVMYWGTGNPGPFPGTKEFPNGSSRPGPNLYTNSLLALNQKDGALRWFKQAVPHDLFDYDLQASPILAKVQISGKTRDLVIAAGKMGKVFAYDRHTGEQLWSTPVGTHLNDDLEKLPPGETQVSPSPLGGVETPLAYAGGVVYVSSVDLTVAYTPAEFVAKSFDLGKGKGVITAISAVDGQVLWEVKLNSLAVGAVTVVNDLVFTSTFDGKIYALARETGKIIWSYQAPGGINGWPAVKGDTIIFPIGVGPHPVLLALKLGAKAPSGTTPTPLASPAPGKSFQP